MRNRALGMISAGLFFAFPLITRAAYLQNGNFEDFSGTAADPVYAHWDNSGGNVAVSVNDAPAAIQGQHSPQIFYQTEGDPPKQRFSVMSQTLTDPGGKLTKWVVEFDVAANKSSSGVSSFSFHILDSNSSANQLFLRLHYAESDTDGKADVQVFDTVPKDGGGTQNNAVNALLNAVTISDSDTDLKVNHFKIVGDYSGATPKYDLYVTDADGATQFSTGRTEFLGVAPATGATIKQINVDDWHLSPDSWYVIDNISVNTVPEPGSMALLGLGGLVMLRRRRGV